MNKSCHWQAGLLEFSKLIPTVTQRKIMQMVAYVPQDSQHEGLLGSWNWFHFQMQAAMWKGQEGSKKGESTDRWGGASLSSGWSQ